MKNLFQKNIFKSILFVIMVFFVGFGDKCAPNPEVPSLENVLNDDQKRVFSYLPEHKQEELKNFFILSQDKKYDRNHSTRNFCTFLDSVRQFLDSEPDTYAKQCKAFIIGIANLEDGSFIVNVRNLKCFTSKSKSSVNIGFKNADYYSIPGTKDVLKVVQKFFGNFLTSYCEERLWTVRVRQSSQSAVSHHAPAQNEVDTGLPYDIAEQTTADGGFPMDAFTSNSNNYVFSPFSNDSSEFFVDTFVPNESVHPSDFDDSPPERISDFPFMPTYGY